MLNGSNLRVMTNGERKLYEDASRYLEEQETLLYNALDVPSYMTTSQRCVFVIAKGEFQSKPLQEAGFKVISFVVAQTMGTRNGNR